MLSKFYRRIGVTVSFRHNYKDKGVIQRVYPFEDRPNILVRWNDGRIKSENPSDLNLIRDAVNTVKA